MSLTDTYPDIVAALVKLIRDDHKLAKAKYYMAPENMAQELRYPSSHNQPLYDMLNGPEAGYLGFRAPVLIRAQKDLQKRRDKERAAADRTEERRKRAEAKQQDTFDALQAELGGIPLDECDYIALLMHKRQYRMSFDREFTDAQGKRYTGEQVSLDAHLTAAKLNLVKPRGDLLGATNIDRALQQWALAQRQACVERVCAQLSKLPADVDANDVRRAFDHVCSLYFKEPAFASAALRKMCWQIKRMLLGLPVEQRHMIVFVGEQGSGKTTVQRWLTEPIAELRAEASLKDVLDERQMELPAFGVILLDELVSSDRADVAALKNFITGLDWARRPMRSNIIEKVRVRATLLGTSNHSLGRLIYDSSGMRRFVELEVLRLDQTTKKLPGWESIKGFDWTLLWQSVDAMQDDPLLAEFGDTLMQKQEELRTAENTELWAEQFDHTSNTNSKLRTKDYVEFFGADLYADFRAYEEEYDRGYRGTNVTRWGRDLKSLIDAGRLPHWSHRKIGSKSVYRIDFAKDDADTNVTPLRTRRQP